MNRRCPWLLALLVLAGSPGLTEPLVATFSIVAADPKPVKLASPSHHAFSP
jgi:hypothetical protein